MRREPRFGPLIGAVVAAVACASCNGRDASGVVAVGNGGTGGVGDDGGTGGRAGEGGAGGEVANDAWWGVTFGVAPDFWWVHFRSYWQSDPSRRANVRDVGDYCMLYDSRTSEYGDTPLSGPSPGAVTLSSIIGADVVLEPNADGFAFANGTGLQWASGDDVRISAPGQELPAFDVFSVVPGPVAGVVPDVPGDGVDDVVIDLSQDYEVRWTPTDQIVDFELWQSGPGDVSGTNALILACYFPGGDGAGALPVEGLSRFAADAGDVGTELGVAHVHWLELELGGRPFIAPGFNWASRAVLTE